VGKRTRRIKRPKNQHAAERLENRELLSTLLEGRLLDDQSGTAITALGSLRDPTRGDFAIGAPFADPGGRASAGEVYVLFGDPSLITTNRGPCPATAPSRVRGCEPIDTYLTALDGVSILGDVAGDQFGFSVAGVGDVDGDALPDLLVGAPGRSSGNGAAYLIPGSVILNELTAAVTPGVLDLNLQADRDLVLFFPGGPGDQYGTSVAGIGRQAFLIGGPGFGTGRGVVDIYQGADTARESRLEGPHIGSHLGGVPPTEIATGFKGNGVSGVRNPALLPVSSQGVAAEISVYDATEPDILVGAPDACYDTTTHAYSCNGTNDFGLVYLISGTPLLGPAAGTFRLDNDTELKTLHAIVVRGAERGDRLGATVSSAGNLDGLLSSLNGVDNKIDFMFSAPNRNTRLSASTAPLDDGGEVYIVFGREVRDPETEGFYTDDGDTIINDGFCAFPAGGLPRDNFRQCRDNAGRVIPISAGQFEPTPTGTAFLPVGLLLKGEQPFARAGMSLAEAGNVDDPVGRTVVGQQNRLGVGEILIGAPLHDNQIINPPSAPITLTDVGRVYAILGNTNYDSFSGNVQRLDSLATTEGLVRAGHSAGDFFGIAVSGVGNVADSAQDGAGNDWAVGANRAEGTGIPANAGETEVMFGSTGVAVSGGGQSPLPFIQPGTFGPQLFFPGYVSFTSQLPPASSVAQFPLIPSQIRDLQVVQGTDSRTILEGRAAQDLAGLSISAIGPNTSSNLVNDFAIAAPFADPQNRNAAGEVYVMYADIVDPNPLDNVAPPDYTTLARNGCNLPANQTEGCEFINNFLTTQNAVVIQGEAAGNMAGYSVAGIGDVDQDTVPDLLIGAPFVNGGQGRAYLIRGAFIRGKLVAARGSAAVPKPIATIDLSSPADLVDPVSGQANIVVLTGTAAGDFYGTSVAGIGNREFLVGAPGFNGDRGAVDVFQGGTGPVANPLSRLIGPSAGAHLGGVLPAIVVASQGTRGNAVAGVRNPALVPVANQSTPDFISVYDTTDPDILVGAPDACFNPTDPSNFVCTPASPRTGMMYLISGALGAATFNLGLDADLKKLKAIVVRGAQESDQLGAAVSSAGNIDGETNTPSMTNRIDFMFGAPNREVTSAGGALLTDAGETYLVFGREVRTPDAFDPSTIHLLNAAGDCVPALPSAVPDNFRQCRDGLGRVIPMDASDFANTVPVGFTFRGSQAGERAGAALAEAGNVIDPTGLAAASLGTQVGAGEILIGAPLHDVADPVTGLVLPDAGRMYVFFGNRGYQTSSGEERDLGMIANTGDGKAISGQAAGDNYGISVAGLGNVDNPDTASGPDFGAGINRLDVTAGGVNTANVGGMDLRFGSTSTPAAASSSVSVVPAEPLVFPPGTVGPFVSANPYGALLFLPDKPQGGKRRGGQNQAANLGNRRDGRVANVNQVLVDQVLAPPINATAAPPIFIVDRMSHLIEQRRNGRSITAVDLTGITGGPNVREIVAMEEVFGSAGSTYQLTARTTTGDLVTYSGSDLTGWTVSTVPTIPAAATPTVLPGRGGRGQRRP